MELFTGIIIIIIKLDNHQRAPEFISNKKKKVKNVNFRDRRDRFKRNKSKRTLVLHYDFGKREKSIFLPCRFPCPVPI